MYEKQKNLRKWKFAYTTNVYSYTTHMAKGKCTYQIGKSESGLNQYVKAIQKKNLPQGQKLERMKYDKKLRKHVKFTFKDVK